MVSDSENDKMIKSSQETKQIRAQLRERFLKEVNQLNGKSCNILTYEQSKLEATFSAWKPDGLEILVTDLKTPANIKMSSALLRAPDIIAITFDETIQVIQDSKPK